MKDVFKMFLVAQSIGSFISAVIYSIKGDNRWFSRFCLVIFCLSIYFILDSINNKPKT